MGLSSETSERNQRVQAFFERVGQDVTQNVSRLPGYVNHLPVDVNRRPTKRDLQRALAAAAGRKECPP